MTSDKEGKPVKKRILISAVLLILAAAGLLIIKSGLFDRPPEPTEDEVMLKVRLDVSEDIGLLIMDYEIGEKSGSGGFSNANRTKLKKDDLLYWTFSKKELKLSDNETDLKIRFRIITEYFEPNYENIYPEEYTVPIEEISLKVRFAGTYDVIITGNSTEGYKAVPVPEA